MSMKEKISLVGVINTYTCPNGHTIVTIDRDDGTTPFMTQCPHCTEYTKSHFYRVDQSLTPEYEWYKPTEGHRNSLTGSVRNHVDMGGLLLRKIDRSLSECATETVELLEAMAQGSSAVYNALKTFDLPLSYDRERDSVVDAKGLAVVQSCGWGQIVPEFGEFIAARLNLEFEQIKSGSEL